MITVQMSLSSEQAVGMAQKPPLAWPTSRHSSEVPKWNLAETEQGARCCGDLRYSRRSSGGSAAGGGTSWAGEGTFCCCVA